MSPYRLSIITVEEQNLQDVESLINKGNNKITEFRTILQRESQNS
jgi:hypothetical protein